MEKDSEEEKTYLIDLAMEVTDSRSTDRSLPKNPLRCTDSNSCPSINPGTQCPSIEVAKDTGAVLGRLGRLLIVFCLPQGSARARSLLSTPLSLLSTPPSLSLSLCLRDRRRRRRRGNGTLPLSQF